MRVNIVEEGNTTINACLPKVIVAGSLACTFVAVGQIARVGTSLAAAPANVLVAAQGPKKSGVIRIGLVQPKIDRSGGE